MGVCECVCGGVTQFLQGFRFGPLVIIIVYRVIHEPIGLWEGVCVCLLTKHWRSHTDFLILTHSEHTRGYILMKTPCLRLSFSHPPFHQMSKPFVHYCSSDLVSSIAASSSLLDLTGSVGQSFIPLSVFVLVNPIHR